MALTAEKSVQVTAELAGRQSDSVDYKGSLQLFRVDFTQSAAAGDANSTADLAILPPGKWRYCPSYSRLATSAFGASRTLDLGHAGYTEPDGDVIAASENAFDTAKDVSAAVAWYPGQSATVDDNVVINSRTPVIIRAKCESGTLPAAATIKGTLGFMRCG
jgi:hypothetical protein